MQFFDDWKSLRRFRTLEPQRKILVFYAESAADWPHFKGIVNDLLLRKQDVTYVTSDKYDKILNSKDPSLSTFCIGMGTFRTLFFQMVDCKVMVITLPDLDKYNLKRSVNKCHYIYLFHSINSTHMVYRESAFDAYDTIFCVGPHHKKEIRATEKHYKLKAKNLFEHGYERLDAIINKYESLNKYIPSSVPEKNVVIAPSWGVGSFIEDACGTKIISALLDKKHNLVLRLHPMTVRRFPRMVSDLQNNFGDRGLKVETNMYEQESLQSADIMISDWSGAALEFSFGTGRPVLFVDMPPKVHNPHYKNIKIDPFEVSIRNKIGKVVSAKEPELFASIVTELCQDINSFKGKILKDRNEWIYNIGNSSKVGADKILEILISTQTNKDENN